MSKKKFDVVAIVGTYKNRDGEEKKQYLKCGSVLERDDGSLCMKLDAVPVGGDGWFSFYEPKQKDAKPGTDAAKPVSNSAKPTTTEYDGWG